MFDKTKNFETTRAVCGFEAGTKVKPAVDKAKEPIIGASGKTQMFTVPNGGGLYLGKNDVTEV